MMTHEIHFDTISVITALGIAQGLFLSVALLGVRSGNIRANRILSLIVFLTSLSIGHGVLTYTNLYYYFPHLILIGHPIAFLFGPLLLLYLNYLTDNSYRFRKRMLAAFLPSLICVIVLVPFYMKDGAEKLRLLTSFLENGELYLPSQVMGILAIPHMILYLFIIWRKISQHKRNVKESYSHTQDVQLNWVHYFVMLYFLVFLLMIPATIFRLTGSLNLEFERLVPLLTAISMYYFGYMGFQQQAIREKTPEQEGLRKNTTYTMPPEQLDVYKKKLESLLETEKIYRDPELTLTDLSRELEISRNQLSYVINNEFGVNFFTLINSYRIAEVKEEIIDQPENSVLNIALNAGFNSKATFNSVFKKMTGTTPSQYKKNRE